MALAPMANVTDAAFRRIIAQYGKPARPGERGGPDVMFTEFVSADGLVSKGRDKLLVDLMYSESERPIVAQLFSGNPEKMYEAAKLVKELKFDGLDINMGCPDRSIEKSGAGAALIKNPRLARELIRAAKEGSGLPISIKTRLGYNKDTLEEWLPELLAEKPAVVILHARTRKEMSKAPARFERVKRAVEIRDECQKTLAVKTLILGNGDVMNLTDACQKAAETGADGIMLGRAIFGNPWLFAGGERSDLMEPSIETKLKVLIEHTKLFEKLLGEHKNFAIMKKHFKAYVEGFAGAKELRMKLMEAVSASEVENIVARFIASQ
ncbi:MAG: tRNA-dihydrouridine synthase [Parcubacteria group bacterium GW2011_GWA2_47_64]|nr:MAG: tRNA-dihydrouridine synthase [Parcubacteria group bacterium GW2011_GWA2_47_64]KKU96724.1 MAG: tRNA-dihydrouridine synthase [Parcubacteria group bacterium GW2011_GWC2_48_17]